MGNLSYGKFKFFCAFNPSVLDKNPSSLPLPYQKNGYKASLFMEKKRKNFPFNQSSSFQEEVIINY
ncbi:hypothetical protein [Dapis sp. BLCC M172]|uniref:hypothetical protein n=1 Tax=Dapis sp. BLCC M172 TaxID=2975281 RepID=UPI003CF48FBB